MAQFARLTLSADRTKTVVVNLDAVSSMAPGPAGTCIRFPGPDGCSVEVVETIDEVLALGWAQLG